MTGPTYPLPPVCACGLPKSECEQSPYCPMTDAELSDAICRLEEQECDCEGEYFTDRAAPVLRRCRRCRDLEAALEERDERERAAAEHRADQWRDANDFARKETP